MIGANLVRHLVSAGHVVEVIDNLWRGSKDNLLDQDGMPVIDMETQFHEIDLSVPGAADDIFAGKDYVYHLADIVAGIGYVFNNQREIFSQNVLINTNVISAVTKHHPKGYIYVGTACSFPAHLQSGVDAAPLKEDDQYPASPESAYGWSKLMGEYESLLLEEETGIPVSILVLHNVFGAPSDFSRDKSQVIPSLIRKAIEYPATPFDVWGSGAQGRAFVHVDDIVKALDAARTKGLGKGTIQIGPDYCTSIREIAEYVVEISGKDIEINYDTSKPEGDRGRRADYSKANAVLGWEPNPNIREGLEDLYRWIEAQLEKTEAPPPSPTSL